MVLQPCSRCRRHVDIEETTCPFCAQAIARGPSPVLRIAARLTRAAIFAGASSCYTSPPATQAPQPIESAQGATAPGIIQGRVTNADTGQPMPGMAVYLEAPDGSRQETRSDVTGEYRFTGLPQGEYDVSTRTSPAQRRRRKREVPEQKPAGTRLKAGETRVQHVDYYPHVPNANPVDMPYGAPPRRSRRV